MRRPEYVTPGITAKSESKSMLESNYRIRYSIRAGRRYQQLQICSIVGVALALICLFSQSLGPFAEAVLLGIGDLISSPLPLPDGSAILSLLTNISVLLMAGWPLSLLLENFIQDRDVALHEHQWQIVKAIVHGRLLNTVDKLLRALLPSTSIASRGFYYRFVRYDEYSPFDIDSDFVHSIDYWDIIEGDFKGLVRDEKYARGAGKKRIDEIVTTLDETRAALEAELKLIAALLDHRLSENIMELIAAIENARRSEITWENMNEDPHSATRSIFVLAQAGMQFWRSIACMADEKSTDREHTEALIKELDSIWKQLGIQEEPEAG